MGGIVKYPAGIFQLTVRQKEILRLVAARYQEKEIARLLNISLPTVKDHAAKIRRLLDVDTTRVAALLFEQFEKDHGIHADQDLPPKLAQQVSEVVTADAPMGDDWILKIKKLPPLGWAAMVLVVAFASSLLLAALMGTTVGLLETAHRLGYFLGY